jgi:hypothetical protein
MSTRMSCRPCIVILRPVLLAVLTVAAAGCVDRAGSGQPAAADKGAAAAKAAPTDPDASSTPEAAVFEFLEAVRTGNDQKAAMMLTTTARQKTAEENIEVTPPGSQTAAFKIGNVQYLNDYGARVATTWSDLDANSQRQTHEFLWMVRREPEGWRIAGVATPVFPGEPPLLVDFEKPKEMLRKQQWVEEEIRRRVRQQGPQQNSQAQNPENPGDPVRR